MNSDPRVEPERVTLEPEPWPHPALRDPLLMGSRETWKLWVSFAQAQGHTVNPGSRVTRGVHSPMTAPQDRQGLCTGPVHPCAQLFVLLTCPVILFRDYAPPWSFLWTVIMVIYSSRFPHLPTFPS